jgi:predicted ATPase with chaperone activity
MTRFQALMKTRVRQLQLMARTIADIGRSEAITRVHLAEVLQYRPKLDFV